MSAIRSSEPAVGRREGPDLDSLVAEIAADHPQPVRFLDVDRVRRGGVLGFFAKEQYALTYELDDDAASLAPPVTAAAHLRDPHDADPVDLEDLLGRADAADIPLAPPAAPTGPTLGEVLAARPAPAPTTAGDRFADILLSLARDVADGTDDLDALVPTMAPAAVAPAAVPAPVAAPPAEVLAPSDDDVTAGRHRSERTVFEPTALTLSAPPVAPPAVAPAPEPVVAVDPVVAAPAATAEVTAPAVVRDAAVDADADADADVSARLADLGIAPAFRVDPDPVRTAVVAAVLGAVTRRPAPPAVPTSPGDLVVFVDGSGPADGAHEVVDATGPRAVRAAVAAIRAGERAGALSVASDDDGLAAAVVGADLVVVHVDATGKTSDQHRVVERVRRVGGRVDALAVDRAGLTGSPASVWDLDVPVLTLDGRPADPAAWLTVLLAALDAG